MDNPNLPPLGQPEDIIPANQAAADALHPEGLQDTTLGPQASPIEDIVYQNAYQASRNMVEKHFAKEENKQLQKENADLREDLSAVEEASEYDPKTGLLNPVAFKEHVEAATRTVPNRRQTDVPAGTLPRSHALLMFDIDNFKPINTAIGHLTADESVLLPVANILKKVRPGDFAGRFGGEEFTLFLSDVDKATAIAIASRFQHQINGVALPQTIEGKNNVGISIGLADFPEGASYDEVLGKANAALLAAKQASSEKNMIMTNDQLAPVPS